MEENTQNKIGTFVSSAVSRIINIVMILVIIALVSLVAYFWHNNELLKQEVKGLQDEVKKFEEMNNQAGNRDVVVGREERVVEDVVVENNKNEEIVLDSESDVIIAEEVVNSISGWKTYKNSGMKLSISYPNDGTYSIENVNSSRFIITQNPGNRFHIEKTLDSTNYLNASGTKTINNIDYKVFYYEGMGDSYGYITKKDDDYYIFLSVWGPKNQVFEDMMKTIKFE